MPEPGEVGPVRFRAALVGARAAERAAPAAYLWAPDVWWRHDAHPGINRYNDSLGMRFAIDAIRAQPLDYLRVTARDVMLVFLSTDRPLTRTSMNFTAQGRYAKLPPYYAADEKTYAGTTENTHAVQPYAYFMFLYGAGLLPRPGVLRGAGGRFRRDRAPAALAHLGVPPALLPWMLAAVSIVIPALLKESLYRYAMVAIPVGCLAAGLAFTRQRTDPVADVPAATPRPRRQLRTSRTLRPPGRPGRQHGPGAAPAPPASPMPRQARRASHRTGKPRRGVEG